MKNPRSSPMILTLLFGELLFACAGSKFESKSNSDAIGGHGSGGETSTIGGAGGAGGTGGATNTEETPCGSARVDPSSYRVELCVPSNTFSMGRANYTASIDHADYSPPHEVTLSSFLIDAYEVTVGRYQACVESGACEIPDTDPTKECTYGAATDSDKNLPVSCVTADQASAFCHWDGNRRLPTEAEWERTATNNDKNAYPWGTTFSCSKAVIAAGSTCSTYIRPLAVGSLDGGKSAAGAYDMIGNVAEWVQDFAGDYPTTAVTDPQGPSTGILRVVRGGSFQSLISDGRVFVRVTKPASTVDAIGFRCARSVEQ